MKLMSYNFSKSTLEKELEAIWEDWEKLFLFIVA